MRQLTSPPTESSNTGPYMARTELLPFIDAASSARWAGVS